jgi:hypothetical protein
MAMSIAAVMDGLGVRLSTISGLRTYDYPADAVAVPAAVVLFPETLTYDDTMARGADRASFQVIVLVGKVSDRSARDSLALYMNGTGDKSVKTVVEADRTLGAAADTARVTEATVETFAVGAVEYLGARFNIDVVA